jgi:hypothetical protein
MLKRKRKGLTRFKFFSKFTTCSRFDFEGQFVTGRHLGVSTLVPRRPLCKFVHKNGISQGSGPVFRCWACWKTATKLDASIRCDDRKEIASRLYRVSIATVYRYFWCLLWTNLHLRILYARTRHFPRYSQYCPHATLTGQIPLLMSE